jgi:hypothetical protein
MGDEPDSIDDELDAIGDEPDAIGDKPDAVRDELDAIRDESDAFAKGIAPSELGPGGNAFIGLTVLWNARRSE